MWMMKPKENNLNDVRTFTAAMVGYYATGKSAILDRFCRNCFDEDYRMTLSNIFNIQTPVMAVGFYAWIQAFQ